VTAPQQGYVLGVDLGTSNTVAVVRSPDGRTRPLLFDGQPIMPSVVFLDDTDRIHVGRDAQRLAQLDPARCEPNPKRRIDEPAILLGDREVPVVALLAAILAAIAAKAVETTGHLPPAVVTYPAQWGPQRRGVLAEAVRQAGWPPVRLVPEPVAAVRYFAQVLRRPVPVGGAVAVFDFGGGTLDVAVVRNDGDRGNGDGGFTVIGSGGQEGLGGLDLDAALVGHLGGLIGPRYPEVWEHLSRPVSTTDRRYRRLFWEDVRGAKEMLSRTTTAPLPVPGVDQAVHVTRDEFERLAGPLLTRAVQVAENVIAGAGMRPDALAGLFLVGGSSRVPLAGRLLHARLGIAPTVLEQPELPVAEGALAELAPPDPEATSLAATPTSGVPTSGVPTSPAGPTSPAAPTSPAGPPPVGLTGPMAPLRDGGPPVPGRPWWRRKSILISAGAAVLALVVAAGLVLYLTGYHERGFTALKSVKTIKYPGNGSGSPTAFTTAVGSTAYLGVQHNGSFQVTAYDLDGGKTLWQHDIGSADDWKSMGATGDVIVVDGTKSDDSGTQLLWAYDRASGKKTWDGSFEDGEDSYFFKGNTLYSWTKSDSTRRAVDVDTGKQLWDHHEDSSDKFRAGFSWDDYAGAADWTGRPEDGTTDAGELVDIDGKGGVTVLNPQNGHKVTSKGNRVDASQEPLIYDGRMFAPSGTDGYHLQAFDLKTLNPVGSPFQVDDTDRRLRQLSVCGKELICALDEKSGDDSTTRLIIFDTDLKSQGSHTVPGAEHVNPVGDRIVVSYKKGSDTVSAIMDDSGKLVGQPFSGAAAPVDDASVLAAPGMSPAGDSSGQDWTLAGVGAQSGGSTQLGPLKADLESCAWTDTYLACPEDNQFQVFSFR
jgi:Hsp70 protein/putative pyrroloquinoline-quinone binding quinoprotein